MASGPRGPGRSPLRMRAALGLSTGALGPATDPRGAATPPGGRRVSARHHPPLPTGSGAGGWRDRAYFARAPDEPRPGARGGGRPGGRRRAVGVAAIAAVVVALWVAVLLGFPSFPGLAPHLPALGPSNLRPEPGALNTPSPSPSRNAPGLPAGRAGAGSGPSP